jgi:hypothetical protein
MYSSNFGVKASFISSDLTRFPDPDAQHSLTLFPNHDSEYFVFREEQGGSLNLIENG